MAGWTSLLNDGHADISSSLHRGYAPRQPSQNEEEGKEFTLPSVLQSSTGTPSSVMAGEDASNAGEFDRLIHKLRRVMTLLRVVVSCKLYLVNQ